VKAAPVQRLSSGEPALPGFTFSSAGEPPSTRGGENRALSKRARSSGQKPKNLTLTFDLLASGQAGA
jgi:hypothetical protein